MPLPTLQNVLAFVGSKCFVFQLNKTSVVEGFGDLVRDQPDLGSGTELGFSFPFSDPQVPGPFLPYPCLPPQSCLV